MTHVTLIQASMYALLSIYIVAYAGQQHRHFTTQTEETNIGHTHYRD